LASARTQDSNIERFSWRRETLATPVPNIETWMNVRLDARGVFAAWTRIYPNLTMFSGVEEIDGFATKPGIWIAYPPIWYISVFGRCSVRPSGFVFSARSSE
jgi:hypothetical protein